MPPKPAEIALPSVTAKAYFGLGCFWAPDGQFPAEEGVLRTRVGYAGGEKKNPTYRNMYVFVYIIFLSALS
jgi:peptide methionine sulfoxide reductase MsrA